MNVREAGLPGVLLVQPRVFEDARGFFFESYHAQRYAAAGVAQRFVQDNHSLSRRDTVRGLHYQLRNPQGKLVRVVRGTVYDVAVDIRRGSPWFGQWVGIELSAANKLQLYIPPGFAHGFAVLSDEAEVEYKCTEYYVADDQHGVLWNDPGLAIPWPVRHAILSDRDRAYEPLSPDRGDLPAYDGLSV
ncbi:MAG TPA: dTDP-4-dehydrorhamnose 3,5-epimerase [Gemmatimonadales bacterium]|nr:dTDP-4-dehydrorhamnose 3,5-epimerase [Gemmatimonadales bacterium]